jgi:DNA-binding transcriptional ArsR family regulator
MFIPRRSRDPGAAPVPRRRLTDLRHAALDRVFVYAYIRIRELRGHPLIPRELIPIVAARFKALGDPGRLTILAALQDGEKAVSEIVEATGRSQPNVSQHLAALSRAGFVAARREGNRVFYAVSDPYVMRICAAVCDGTKAQLQRAGRAARSPRRRS